MATPGIGEPDAEPVRYVSKKGKGLAVRPKLQNLVRRVDAASLRTRRTGRMDVQLALALASFSRVSGGQRISPV